jgi:subtilase family serine protease
VGRHKLVLLGILVMAASFVTVVPASAANSPGTRHVVPGAKPSWTARQAATPVAAGVQVTAQVWLSPRNAAQLDALVRAVSNPKSSQYRKYLTSAQYNQLFAPSSESVAAVRQWLTSAGLHIDSIGADNAYVAVSGSAAAINAAFGTQLAHYVINGKQERAPSREVSVPDGVASTVLAVTGLSTLGEMVKPAFAPPGGFVNSAPCSTYYGQQAATNLPKFNGQTLAYAPCGYVPSQLRSAYGVTSSSGDGGGGGGGDRRSEQSGGLGQGVTVAITDAFNSPTLKSDANTYAKRQGDHGFVGQQFGNRSVPECQTLTTFSCAILAGNSSDGCTGNGWYAEQSLDVEAVHGMAPNANVLYYGAGSCYDIDLLVQLNQVVHDNQASIVTNSWGEPTFFLSCDANGNNCVVMQNVSQQLIDAYESIFKHGAVQGIGFYFSSGDFGDNLDVFGVLHPDFPTDDPWVTSVGGSSLAIGKNGQRLFETGWGTSQWRIGADGTWSSNVAPFQYGAGGGFSYSSLFAQPDYQEGVVKNNPTGGRAVPDIGLVADPNTGMLIGETQNFALSSKFGKKPGVHYGEFRIGGTSLASPLLAGLQADAQSIRGERIGFANPLIYSLAQDRHNPYFDVTPQGDKGDIRADFNNGYNSSGGLHYSVRTFNQDSSLTTGPGWDDVTGVGAPTAAYIQAVGEG